jgi:diguanylate cyclase (GGDEF)-like protein
MKILTVLKNIWRRMNLASKLTALTSFLVMLAVLTFTILDMRQEQANFKQELEDQARLVLDTLPLTMRDSLYNLEIDELDDVANVVISNEMITLFIVYDRRGAILVDASQEELKFDQTVDHLGEKIISLAPESIYRDWQDEQLIAGRKVVLGNTTIGGVAIGFSTHPLDEKIDTLTRQSIFLIIISLGMGGVITFVISQQITNPLGELTNLAGRMAGGEQSLRIDLTSKDEIGKLGLAFNRMAQAIQKRERDLRKLAEDLEQTVADRTEKLRSQNQILEKIAITDSLTQAFNRRHFFDLSEIEIQRALRYGHPLSVMILDVDHFKVVNDTYGHRVGDQVLVNIVRLCQENIRNIDVFARYGGEEFVILLPETDCGETSLMAERICNLVAETPIILGAIKVSVTLSIGVACWDGDQELNYDQLLSQADIALYRAKDQGRNMVEVWQEIT